MKKALYGWTDYPFVELGDEPFCVAPVRSVKAIGYDGDKYVYVIVEGVQTSIKTGYFYKTKGDYQTAAKMPRSAFRDLPEPQNEDG